MKQRECLLCLLLRSENLLHLLLLRRRVLHLHILRLWLLVRHRSGATSNDVVRATATVSRLISSGAKSAVVFACSLPEAHRSVAMYLYALTLQRAGGVLQAVYGAHLSVRLAHYFVVLIAKS